MPAPMSETSIQIHDYNLLNTCIHECDIPQEVEDEYNVKKYIAEDGYVYCKISGAMYGLKAAEYIVDKDLKKHLESHGISHLRKQQDCGFTKRVQSVSH